MKRAVLGVLLGLALSTVGFLLAASYINQAPSVTSYWPIAAGIAATIAAWLIQGTIIALLSWPWLKRVEVLEMTRVYLATQAAGAVTPFAGGEIAYQLLELHRRNLPADAGGAVITIRSVLNGAVLVIAAGVGLVFFPEVPFVGNVSSLPFSARKVLVGGALFVAVVGVLVSSLVAYRRRRAGSGSSGWMAKVSGWKEKAVDYLRHLGHSLRRIWRQEPRAVLACGGLMLLYWAIYPLLGTMALRAAGWDGAGWIHVYLAQFVLFLVIPLAPTPGNSGAAELGFVALMGDYAPHDALLGGVIIWRILNHYSELVVGAFIAGRSLPEDIKDAKRAFGSE